MRRFMILAAILVAACSATDSTNPYSRSNSEHSSSGNLFGPSSFTSAQQYGDLQPHTPTYINLNIAPKLSKLTGLPAYHLKACLDDVVQTVSQAGSHSVTAIIYENAMYNADGSLGQDDKYCDVFVR